MWIILVVLFAFFVQSATITGSIYNENLEMEDNVLVELQNGALQRYLAVDGSYSFEVEPGAYTLVASKQGKMSEEQLIVGNEVRMVYDLFLLESFVDEDELWQQSGEDLDLSDQSRETQWWGYLLGVLILGYGLWRIISYRRKLGSLRSFRRRVARENSKSVEEHAHEVAKDPKYIDDALAILRAHDGRITQKQLRREMNYLSEAKVSLIVSELEHKGVVEKIKKGRGNIVLMKEEFK